MKNKILTFFKNEEILTYGNNVFKVNKNNFSQHDGKLILVTSINPTPYGEGKTTTLIGLNDCMNFYQKKSIACLRQPSMGPFFGIKGGATGSGECSLENPDFINCGFTGDFFAIESATNLILATIENEIYFNSKLNINPKTIMWNRCFDMNDRSLRKITYKINQKNKIKTSFTITAASNLMATFCLAKNNNDLIGKINNTLIAFTFDKKPIYIKDLNISNAITLILNNAFKPNLVFSKYKNPVLIHGGPFANIAHGCNSILATKIALNVADYVFTEAGFGADLGMEKFVNIKCRELNKAPNLIVLTITIKALKHHAGLKNDEFNQLNFDAILKGFANVEKHIDSIMNMGLNFCIVINKFKNDLDEELNFLKTHILSLGHDCEVSTMWENGPQKNKAIFDLVLRNIKNQNTIKYTYDLKEHYLDKMRKIAQVIYGAKDIKLSKLAIKKLAKYEGYIDNYYICFAKNFLSLSSNPNLLGRPKDFIITISDIEFNHSAKFIIPITSNVFLMPGLPKIPNAKKL